MKNWVKHVLISLASLFFPIAGIIIGLYYVISPDVERRKIGITGIVTAILFWIMWTKIILYIARL